MRQLTLGFLAAAGLVVTSAGFAGTAPERGNQDRADRADQPRAALQQQRGQQAPRRDVSSLRGRNIAILVGEGLHDLETLVPMAYATNRGARVTVIGVEQEELKAYNSDMTVHVDQPIERVRPDMFDALIIPGGRGPAEIRDNEHVIRFVRMFYESGKPIAAICHGPQILISAGIMDGKEATCYADVASELREAGAEYKDEAVVKDGNIITSRVPEDIPAFCKAFEEAVAEHTERPQRPAVRDRARDAEERGRGRGRDGGRDRGRDRGRDGGRDRDRRDRDR